MARKSNQKLEYDFDFVNFYLSLFFLQLKLKSPAISPTDNFKDLPLRAAKELHDIMFLENILLIYKGDFSQEVILPILGMMENNFKKSVKLGKKKKILYLLIELLQNISKHAKIKNGSREGIFMISKKGDLHYINTGNFIENDQVEVLNKQLEKITQLDEKELSALYKKILADDESVKSSAGLGLIEIARNSNELSYDIKSIDEDSSFFSLSIGI